MDQIELEILKKRLQEKSEKKKAFSMKIISNSMSPVIKKGEFIEVLPVNKDETYNRFDIIVFLYQKSLWCHYYWNELGDSLWTRSLENIYRNDLPIKKYQILGKVRNKTIPLRIRSKGLLLNTLRGSL